MEKELRHLSLEIRQLEDGKEPKIGGYAAVFNQRTTIFTGLEEIIAKGAFADSLKDDDIRALWSHNPDMVLGRNKNQTLKLWEDDSGLAFSLQLPDTQVGRDAWNLIKRGDVTGMSFGFLVKKESWEMGEQGKAHLRTLEKVQLFEVSPVAFPAYDGTSVSARSLQEVVKQKEIEWMYAHKGKAATKDMRSELKRLLRKLESEQKILLH